MFPRDAFLLCRQISAAELPSENRQRCQARRRSRSIPSMWRVSRLIRGLFGHRQFWREQRLGRPAHLRLALALIRGADEHVLAATSGSAVRVISGHMF